MGSGGCNFPGRGAVGRWGGELKSGPWARSLRLAPTPRTRTCPWGPRMAAPLGPFDCAQGRLCGSKGQPCGLDFKNSIYSWVVAPPPQHAKTACRGPRSLATPLRSFDFAQDRLCRQQGALPSTALRAGSSERFAIHRPEGRCFCRGEWGGASGWRVGIRSIPGLKIETWGARLAHVTIAACSSSLVRTSAINALAKASLWAIHILTRTWRTTVTSRPNILENSAIHS